MSWTRDHTLRLVMAVLVLVIGAWVLRNTEWVQVRQPLPLPEPMRSEGTWVAQQMLQRLGLRTRVAETLPTPPPPQATLVLATPFWRIAVGNDDRLRRWVEGGGHLVVDEQLFDDPPSWWPLTQAEPDRERARTRNDWCRVLSQGEGMAPAFGDSTGFVACLPPSRQLHYKPDVLWLLQSEEQGVEVMRMPLGRGRITAFGGAFGFQWQGARVSSDGSGPARLHNLSNRGLLEGDNAALLAALVDARAGGEVWFVTQVQRPPLPLWLWQVAAPALLLAALALALLLWRAGSRFGPLRADAPPRRRSIATQIEGLADFLFTRQPRALHAAALRALREAAAGRIAGWARLAPSARTTALAKATGLDAVALERAQEPQFARDARTWSDTLALLETARRTLIENPRPASLPRSPR